MSVVAPVDAASCRAMAVTCGQRAHLFAMIGDGPGARKELVLARELCILALKFEQEQNSSQIAAVNADHAQTDYAAQSGDKSAAPLSTAGV